MPAYSDIPIFIDRADVLLLSDRSQADGQLDRAMERFHSLRRAAGVFRLIDPADLPCPLAGADGGTAVVALSLGAELETGLDTPWLEDCCRAGLFQLEAYLSYRVRKWVAPKKLYPCHPALPGGAVAPDLTLERVLDLLPDNDLGLVVGNGHLSPRWSAAYLYPLTGDQKASAVNPCANCAKNCDLRR